MATCALTMDCTVPRSNRNAIFVKAALFVLFVGEGMALVVPWIGAHTGVGVLVWYVSRFNLLVALPAISLGVWKYGEYRGTAKSVPLICCICWMAVSLAWVDPTEVGRGLLTFAGIVVTLPLAALLARSGLQEQCTLWFCTSLVGSFYIAVLCGLENTFTGRWGDVEEANCLVMNSNSLGIGAAFVLLLICWLYENRGVAGNRHTLSCTAYAWYLPCLALGAFVLCAMSVSRTSIIVVVVSVGVILAWHVRKGSVIALRIAATLAFFAIGGSLLLMSESFSVWGERFSDEDVGSLNGRVDIWTAGLDLAVSSEVGFLTGLGAGGADKFLGYATGVGVVHPIDQILRHHSHNQYVECLLEFGVVGVALGAWLAYEMIVAAKWLDQRDGTMTRHAILVFFALYGLAGVTFKMEGWPAVGALLWTFLSPQQEDR